MRARSSAAARIAKPRRRRSRAEPPMAGRALAAGVSTAAPYTLAGVDGRRRVAVVDYGVKRSLLRSSRAAGARVTVFPHDVDAAHARSASTASSSRTARAIPKPLEARGRDRARPARARAAASASASATSCSRSRAGSRPSSCPSATAARTTRCSSARADGCSSRARTTASRSPPAERRRRRTSSLYDGTVEGLAYPELRRAPRCSSIPRRAPGPHDAAPILARWVRGGVRCRGVTTSTRSA